MLFTRPPSSVLRPFVKVLWVSHEGIAPSCVGAPRERVLPSGAMHLVFRLSDEPVRLFDGVDDPIGRRVSHAVVGGARVTPYVRDLSRPIRSVGARLEPGAAELLFGVSAHELAERHTPLDDLWGTATDRAQERLVEAATPQRQLELFEAILAERLPRVRGLHPAVAHALGRFETFSGVREVVGETGYSHRRFIELFRRAVGLSPKLYCRVLRFQSALHELAERSAGSLADLALTAGYSDQSHFNREFREFSGMPPSEYRGAAPRSAYHVPVGSRGHEGSQVNSIQDRR